MGGGLAAGKGEQGARLPGVTRSIQPPSQSSSWFLRGWRTGDSRRESGRVVSTLGSNDLPETCLSGSRQGDPWNPPLPRARWRLERTIDAVAGPVPALAPLAAPQPDTRLRKGCRRAGEGPRPGPISFFRCPGGHGQCPGCTPTQRGRGPLVIRVTCTWAPR